MRSHAAFTCDRILTPSKILLHQKSRVLELAFADGHAFRLPYEYLRVYSPSAEVRGHGPGQEVLQVGKKDVTSVVIRAPLVKSRSTQYGDSQAPNLVKIRAMAAGLFSEPGTDPAPWPTPKPKPSKAPKPTPTP